MALKLVFISGLSASATTEALTAALGPPLDALSNHPSPPFLVRRFNPSTTKTPSLPHAALILASAELAQLFLKNHGRHLQSRRGGGSGIFAGERELRFAPWRDDRRPPKEAIEWWKKRKNGGGARGKSSKSGNGAAEWEQQDPVPVLSYAFGYFRGEEVFVTGDKATPVGATIAYEVLRGQPYLVLRMQDADPTSDRIILAPLDTIESIQSRKKRSDLFVTYRHPPTIETKRRDEEGSRGHPRRRVHAALAGNSLRISFASAAERNVIVLRAKRENLLVGDGTLKISKPPNAAAIIRERLAVLPFPVAFQLESLRHGALLDESQLLELLPASKNLVSRRGEDAAERILVRLGNRLAEMQRAPVAISLLDDSDSEIEVIDSGSIPSLGTIGRAKYLTQNEIKAVLRTEEEDYCRTPSPFSDLDATLHSRHVVLHPTRITLFGPLRGDSNRITRLYGEKNASHFLRVSFREESSDNIRSIRGCDVEELIRSRFASAMRSGLDLGGRRFDFLAWSSSSIKEHTSFFVTSFPDSSGTIINAHTIRSSLGDFDKIQKIPDIESLDPVTGNISCHTDGVGLISRSLAKEVDKAYSDSLSPSQRRRRVKPSVFQIRLGGSKGLLQVDATLEGHALLLRPSMTKYESKSLTLDICDVNNRPLPAFLNRPLISLLEGLGVAPSTFQDLQQKTLDEIKRSKTSFSIGATYVEEMGLAQASRLAQTLRLLAVRLPRASSCEPFLEECLNLVASYAHRELKYRGRIPLPGSWNLIGVADPTGEYLQPGEVYACIHEPGKDPVYLEGPIAISRSPTMHPGDIQLVRAVGKIPDGAFTRFASVKNCVVFSTRGPRSMPSCLGGGDLDGDLYLLITTPSLFPTQWHPPASYEASRMKLLDRDATSFTVVILEERTGQVATAHLALADAKGLLSPECLELAEWHSDAVDYVKSGTPVPKDAIPFVSKRPDFMCSTGKASDEESYYESKKVLGVLFRSIGDAKLTSTTSRAALHNTPSLDPGGALTVAIELGLRPFLESTTPTAKLLEEMKKLMSLFIGELRVICRLHGSITEEEAFVGIHAGDGARETRSQRDAAMRMRERTGALFDALRREVGGGEEKGMVWRAKRAWAAWTLAKETGGSKRTPFGVCSFAWLSMGILLESLEALEDA
ncbi:hypothetical protein RQP46_008415 [Phenoliferia psychrophenolica]